MAITIVHCFQYVNNGLIIVSVNLILGMSFSRISTSLFIMNQTRELMEPQKIWYMSVTTPCYFLYTKSCESLEHRCKCKFKKVLLFSLAYIIYASDLKLTDSTCLTETVIINFLQS